LLIALTTTSKNTGHPKEPYDGDRLWVIDPLPDISDECWTTDWRELLDDDRAPYCPDFFDIQPRREANGHILDTRETKEEFKKRTKPTPSAKAKSSQKKEKLRQ